MGQKAELNLQHSDYEALIQASGFVNGSLRLDDGTMILRSEILGLKTLITYHEKELKVSFYDSLGRRGDSIPFFWVFVNTFKRGCKSVIIHNHKRGELVSIARFVSGDVFRGYEQVFTSKLLSEALDIKRSDIGRISSILGGKLVDHLNTDLAYKVEPFHSVRIRIAFWRADGELAPYVSILYGEETLSSGIHIEYLKFLTAFLVSRLISCYELVRSNRD